MGNDANANLCLGIALSEDEWSAMPWCDPAIYEDHDFDVWWAEQNGIPKPEADYGESSIHLYEAYWAAKRECVKMCPAIIIRHGCDSATDHILAVVGSNVSGDWSDPTEVDLVALLGRGEPLAGAFKQFCRRFNLSDKEPTWLLSAYYG